MQKDSVFGTLVIAAGLCICCSILVSSSAVILKPRQDANKALDIKKNLLLASGLLKDSSASKQKILATYKKIRTEHIVLSTGEAVKNGQIENFNQRRAAKDSDLGMAIPRKLDTGGIKRRSKISTVYKVFNGDRVDMIILPINGKGLWSTLYGFIALSANLSEIRGIGFYEHGETPGLGAEIDNPDWKAQWIGKRAFNQDLEPKIRVIKGRVDTANPNSHFQIDGLSGATITSNGVSGLVNYWLGAHGFGPYLKKYSQQLAESGVPSVENN